MDRREHRRVRLRLPVRLRWTTPFGQKIEICETMDVSRDGLLVSAGEPHSPRVPLWVTSPYDASLPDGQPEILARVVRTDDRLVVPRATRLDEKVHVEKAIEQAQSAKLSPLVRGVEIFDAPPTFAVAIHFGEKAHPSSNGEIHYKQPERRSSPRRALALPIRVRPERIPWFEEAMTIEFSARGMRFQSHREYEPGDRLMIAFKRASPTPWPGMSEFLCRVVRVVPVPDSFALDISVCREK